MGDVFKALADPTRRRLLLRLVQGPAFPSDLADDLGLTRANVSNHLTCLRGCGLVSTEPVGRRVRYQLADPRLAGALAQLASLVLVVSGGRHGLRLSLCLTVRRHCHNHSDGDRYNSQDHLARFLVWSNRERTYREHNL